MKIKSIILYLITLWCVSLLVMPWREVFIFFCAMAVAAIPFIPKKVFDSLKAMDFAWLDSGEEFFVDHMRGILFTTSILIGAILAIGAIKSGLI